MHPARLIAARQAGLPALGDRVSVMGPGPQADLSDWARATVVTTDRVSADHFAARGMDVAQVLPPSSSVIVQLPRSKDLGRAMIAEAACAAQDWVVIDGAKTDGADSILRDLKKRIPSISSLSKAHGRVMWFAAPLADLPEWRDPGPQQGVDGFFTQPGVYSAGKIDAGSRLLAGALPDDIAGQVADLGAGWGYLAAHVLRSVGIERLHLVETERRALDCARLNVDDPRARFHWADATTWAPEAPVDAVVMNPPFHAGRDGDPALGQAFITNAARMLKPQGRLWMVANRHLPYEATLADRFAQVDPLEGTSSFKLFCASRPRR